MSYRRSARRARQSGFTLIELMVSMLILAAIALPAYGSHIRKARRVDAKNAVLDLAARQERFFSVNNNYTDDMTQLGYSAKNNVQVNAGGTAYYTLAAALIKPLGFAATAMPISPGSQAGDTDCYGYRVDDKGSQTNVSSLGVVAPAPGCW